MRPEACDRRGWVWKRAVYRLCWPIKGQKKEIQDNLRVLYKTRGMSPHPIMAHSRVSKAHKELVRKAFLEMGQTEEGKKKLAGIPINAVSTASKDDYLVLAEWGLEKFLSELCSQKVKLEADCYKNPGVNIYTFEVQVFEE